MRTTANLSVSQTISDTDIAWLAGLLEGEGTFRLQSRSYYKKDGKLYGPYQYPRLSVGMTDEDVIQHARQIIGTGKIYRSVDKRDTTHKPIYTLVVSTTNDVLYLCRLLLPHMGERRKQQIELVLNSCAR